MFLQVIQGRVSDHRSMRAHHDRWLTAVAPNAVGWLGSIAGVTPDDRFVCLTRFSSVESSQRLARLPEQREWWARTQRLVAGPVVATEFLDVATMGQDDGADIGFVQVATGRAEDPARLRALEKELLRYLPDGRPDIVGAVLGVRGDGRFVRAMSFSTEELARAGEHGEQLPEIADVVARMRDLAGEPSYHDLRHPWLAAPTG
jgi:hypothetical protein